MANFSIDQVRQFYPVVNRVAPTGTLSATGDAQFKSANGLLWLNYMSPNGLWETSVTAATAQVTRSDTIKIANIAYAKATTGATRKLVKKEITFATSVNSGAPVVGQDYLLNFVFYGLGVGGPENQYAKTGAAYKVKAGDTAATVYEWIAELAKANFNREPFPYVHVYTDTWDPWLTATKPGTSTKLIVEEVPQPWSRGKKQASQISFDVLAAPITWGGDYVAWGDIVDVTTANTNYIPSGRITADLEWFHLGARGEQYRQDKWIGYDVNYLVDPTKDYDFIDIEYFYQGNNEDIQKSTRWLTLVAERTAAAPSTAISALVGDLTTLSIPVTNALKTTLPW
jgi:hypothetical protein